VRQGSDGAESEGAPAGSIDENLKDYSPAALRKRLAAEGLPGYRADQIAGWLYGRGVEDPRAMTDLDQDLREHLAARWRTRALEIEEFTRSSDGTVKGALRADDGAVIEAVVIPEEQRTTLCISSQVGCPLACSFCASGLLGFARNLRTAEIVDQLCRIREVLPEARRITNIVFMGMGEPLLNLPNVVEAIRILLHPKAFAFAPRRVTVSTVGIAPKIRELLAQVPVNLAVSLHATTDEVRDQLVPINRRFPLAELLGTLRGLPAISPRHPVFFEYTLIEGLNDAPEDARRLVGLLRGIPSKVNLIPLNSHAGSDFRPTSPEVADRFVGELVRGGITTTLRRSRGADIDAACGQLVLRGRRAALDQDQRATRR
jgi:23S rRNA (adenine2503-C2)-methyltransferase